ncbi:hypothetical protein LSTR_LSTR003987 [Laodelphax striatellus]|uniref:DDE-1 domain-containing protein n=1 Tax=Laodelphax striatellus TaxID=195883 RepID=A0A482WF49_LAOST|nr:hypothetical protein LSTR_LSTR003987 [Laodelphax striatellus]
MMAVNGRGDLLPPFTVYKSQFLYPTWIERWSPRNEYGCSKSEWFDMRLFEEWFITVALVLFRDKVGRKLLIVYKLASHFSAEVIRLCKGRASQQHAWIMTPTITSCKTVMAEEEGIFASESEESDAGTSHEELVDIPMSPRLKVTSSLLNS